MSVSQAEEQKRAGVMAFSALGVLLAIPLVGDILGLFLLVVPLYAKTFIKSSARLPDFAILTALILLFFPGSYLWFYVMSFNFFGWAFVLGTRFFIVAKMLPWYRHRIGDD